MKDLKYDWTRKNYPKKSGLKVFGIFVCGGGSTMGYKLAEFQHLGGVEIDDRMAKLYKKITTQNTFICKIFENLTNVKICR